MIKTLKIILIPNNKQKSKLVQSTGLADFIYNWVLGREQEKLGMISLPVFLTEIFFPSQKC